MEKKDKPLAMSNEWLKQKGKELKSFLKSDSALYAEEAEGITKEAFDAALPKPSEEIKSQDIKVYGTGGEDKSKFWIDHIGYEVHKEFIEEGTTKIMKDYWNNREEVRKAIDEKNEEIKRAFDSDITKENFGMVKNPFGSFSSARMIILDIRSDKEKVDEMFKKYYETPIQLIDKNMKQPKYYDGKEGRVVIDYGTTDLAGIHPDTPLENIGSLSDGYHTFDELYEFRKMYNAVLFNEWGNPGFDILGVKYNVHKSWKHYDGELAFGGGWFIVSAMLPTGLISNHYKAEDWDLFKVPEVDKALFEFDGHTGADVLERLKVLTK